MEMISISKLDYKNLLYKSKLADELQLQNKEYSSKIENLYNEKKELLKQIEVLKEKIVDLQKRLFSRKTDRIKNKKLKSIGKKSETDKGGKPGRKPIDKSQVDITQYYDFIEPPICEGCTDTMEHMGSNDSYHEDYQVVIKKVKISKAKYICRTCKLIKVATGHRLPIRKGLPMPAFLAQIILDKFSNGVPFYRQAQIYGYYNHTYTRQMFNKWTAIAGELLTPLHELSLLNMLKARYLASDETNVTLLRVPGKETSGTAYICVLKQFGEKFNFVYCWVINSRKQIEINDLLKDFKGYLQTDGLNFYSKLEKVLDTIILRLSICLRISALP
jgi:transposase